MAKPIRHVFVCSQNRGPGHPRGSCAQSGAATVLEEFAFEFQQRNLNQRYGLTATGCLGPCNGPHVLVYPEGVMYWKVGNEDVKTIVEQHLQGGEVVERLCAPKELWG